MGHPPKNHHSYAIAAALDYLKGDPLRLGALRSKPQAEWEIIKLEEGFAYFA